MTDITYKDGRMKITQSGVEIEFRVSDLDYESRANLLIATYDVI